MSIPLPGSPSQRTPGSPTDVNAATTSCPIDAVVSITPEGYEMAVYAIARMIAHGGTPTAARRRILKQISGPTGSTTHS